MELKEIGFAIKVNGEEQTAVCITAYPWEMLSDLQAMFMSAASDSRLPQASRNHAKYLAVECAKIEAEYE